MLERSLMWSGLAAAITFFGFAMVLKPHIDARKAAMVSSPIEALMLKR